MLRTVADSQWLCLHCQPSRWQGLFLHSGRGRRQDDVLLHDAAQATAGDRTRKGSGRRCVSNLISMVFSLAVAPKECDVLVVSSSPVQEKENSFRVIFFYMFANKYLCFFLSSWPSRLLPNLLYVVNIC